MFSIPFLWVSLPGLHCNRHCRFYAAGRSLWLGWLLHYVPFFFMARQLFLHHYLPAAALRYAQCFTQTSALTSQPYAVCSFHVTVPELTSRA